jgi:hypothetical protein
MQKPMKSYKKGLKIVVNDKMQRNYTYELSQNYGKNLGEMSEALTPLHMLKCGVFSGKYLNDCKNEFPKEWYEDTKLSIEADDSLNCFKVKSRQSLQTWKTKNWIIEPDVRGWFQWWCRYYIGRRNDAVDAKQIKRWKAFKRHVAQVEKNAIRLNRVGDPTYRSKQRQALLQWAYDPYPDVKTNIKVRCR